MDNEGSRFMVLVLGLMAFWCNGDNYVAAPLIVEVTRDFQIGTSTAALMVTAYMLYQRELQKELALVEARIKDLESK